MGVALKLPVDVFLFRLAGRGLRNLDRREAPSGLRRIGSAHSRGKPWRKTQALFSFEEWGGKQLSDPSISCHRVPELELDGLSLLWIELEPRGTTAGKKNSQKNGVRLLLFHLFRPLAKCQPSNFFPLEAAQLFQPPPQPQACRCRGSW